MRYYCMNIRANACRYLLICLMSRIYNLFILDFFMSVNHKILLSCLAHFYFRPLGAVKHENLERFFDKLTAKKRRILKCVGRSFLTL